MAPNIYLLIAIRHHSPHLHDRKFTKIKITKKKKKIATFNISTYLSSIRADEEDSAKKACPSLIMMENKSFKAEKCINECGVPCSTNFASSLGLVVSFDSSKKKIKKNKILIFFAFSKVEILFIRFLLLVNYE